VELEFLLICKSSNIVRHEYCNACSQYGYILFFCG